MGKIWAVCSGSGGAGKTTVALSLAVGAAKAGKRTLLLDAGGVARACDLMLGMESIVVLDMADVASGQAKLEQAIYAVPGRENLRYACASLYDDVPAAELSATMLALRSMCDVLVIDLATGQSDLGAGLMTGGDERLMVVTPDDASIRAAERTMNRCGRDQAGMSLIINKMNREAVKKGAQYEREAVEMTLDRMALGVIPEDASVMLGRKKGQAAIECGGAAKDALRQILKTLTEI